jgi:esterase/lipase superfamily enzyme
VFPFVFVCALNIAMEGTFNYPLFIYMLVENWQSLALLIDEEDIGLNKKLNKIIGRILKAKNEEECKDIVNSLVKILKNSAAENYVNELLVRSQISMPKVRVRSKYKYIKYCCSSKVDNYDGFDYDPLATSLSALDHACKNINEKYISVSCNIYYITNRDIDGSSGFFSNIPSKKLNYGCLDVTIPISVHKIGAIEKGNWWNVLEQKNDPRRHIIISGNKVNEESEFVKNILTNSSDKVLIYIHGYNATFKEAALRAAQLSFDLQLNGRIILYSWPSSGNYISYSSDEEKSISSAKKLTNVLSLIADSDCEKIDLLGHSMGGRVVFNSLRDISLRKSKINQTLFAAADIYTGLFEEYFGDIKNKSLRYSFYSSSKDIPLILSNLLHKGNRVGLIKNGRPFSMEGVDSIDVSNVSNYFWGHNYYADERAVLTDINVLLKNNLNPSARGLLYVKESNSWKFPK